MSMLNTLREQRDAAVTEAENLLAGEPTAEALDAAAARQSEIADLDARISTAEALEARTAVIAESRKDAGVKTFGSAVVTREEMTYDKTERNSFVKDTLAATIKNDSAAWERLNRHAQEIAVESRDWGRGSDGTDGFVPPLYLVNEYAALARAVRVTADLATGMALPMGSGGSINIPAITTGTKTAIQAGDNAAVTNQAVVNSTVTARIETIAGYTGVSMQEIEMSPLQGGIDRVVFSDLLADYALQLNTAVVGNTDGTSYTLKGYTNLGLDTTNGIPVTWTESTPTVAGMLAAISKAVSKVVTNRYRAADAIVMSPAHWYWLSQSVDGSQRPLVVPTAGGPFNAAGVVEVAGGSAGRVGTIAGIPVYIDATLAKVNTTQYPILVGKFDDSFLFESGVKTRVLPEISSANLTVRFQAYGYVALAHRYAKAVSGISGTGAVAPSGF